MRIALVSMRTMTFFERGLAGGTVSLGELLLGKRVSAPAAKPSIRDIVTALAIGGWADNLSLTPDEALDANADYLDIKVMDGRWLGVEVKMGHQRVDEGADNLLALRGRLSEEADNRCSGLIVVVADSPTYPRPDGVT